MVNFNKSFFGLLGCLLWYGPLSASPSVCDDTLQSLRVVRASYDNEGVFVYQAYAPTIADSAVQYQAFLPASGFATDRMTWLKLSLSWLLHRSDWARSPNQSRILRIKIPRAFFLKLLEQGVPSAFDPRLGVTASEYRKLQRETDVIYQWDPDRDLLGRKLQQRVLQIGIRGQTLQAFATLGGLQIEDITPAVRAGKHEVEPLLSEKPFELRSVWMHRLLVGGAQNFSKN